MAFSRDKPAEKRSELLDPDVHLIFAPGPFNQEIWRHQIRYFSQCYQVSTVNGPDYSSQERHLEQLLDREEVEDAVLVSHNLSNSLAQEFEYREEMIATVLTGVKQKYSLRTPRSLYDLFWGFSFREPKIFKKLFFSENTDYSIAHQFMEDVEKPRYSDLKTFLQNYSFRKPVKKSLIVHSGDDRFSSLEKARQQKPNVSISVIRNAGTFSFYEKPQEYNKAMLDFLKTLEGFIKSREVSRTKEKNRSLAEFSRKARVEK